MAFLLTSKRPTLATASSNILAVLVVWLAKARAAHAQRKAFSDLLEMEPERLDDLGICREDVLAATNRLRYGRALAQKRAEAASLWLNR